MPTVKPAVATGMATTWQCRHGAFLSPQEIVWESSALELWGSPKKPQQNLWAGRPTRPCPCGLCTGLRSPALSSRPQRTLSPRHGFHCGLCSPHIWGPYSPSSLFLPNFFFLKLAEKNKFPWALREQMGRAIATMRQSESRRSGDEATLSPLAGLSSRRTFGSFPGGFYVLRAGWCLTAPHCWVGGASRGRFRQRWPAP